MRLLAILAALFLALAGCTNEGDGLIDEDDPGGSDSGIRDGDPPGGNGTDGNQTSDGADGNQTGDGNGTNGGDGVGADRQTRDDSSGLYAARGGSS